MLRQRAGIIAAGLALFWATVACATLTRFSPLNAGASASATATAAPAAGANEDVTAQLAVLTAIDQAVREQSLTPDLGGANWDAAVAQTRARITAGLAQPDFEAALRTLVAGLPANGAAYTTRAERLALETQNTGAYQGIGVYYGFRSTPEPRMVVLEVIANSPAEAAGLKAHDAVYAIDGQPVRADEADTIGDRVRGPAGSTVTLSVQTPGQPRRDVKIQRGKITAASNLRGGVEPSSGLALYRLPVSGGADLAQSIAGSLSAAAKTKPARAIVLDLRTAGASGAWPLTEMWTLFGNGNLGEFYTRTQTETVTVAGQDIGGSQIVPLIILVGPDTRGNPERFAAALQAAGRAKVFGLPPAGQTQGFSQIDLPDGSQLSLATSSFRLVNGTDLARGPLQPSQVVDGDWDTFTTAEQDKVLNAALDALPKP